jgi:hypothetical protein
MPYPIVRGSLRPIKVSEKIQFDPTNGTTTRTEWKAISGQYLDPGDGRIKEAHGLYGKAAEYESVDAQYDHSVTGGISTLVATEMRNIYQDDEEVLETWELFSGQFQADIKTHAEYRGMSLALRTNVLFCADKSLNGKSFTPTGWTVGDLTTADQFFHHITRGKTHYLKPIWSLRVSFNVSNTYQLGVDEDGGVGTIYTLSQISSAAPSGRLQSTLQSITSPTADSYIIYGWLKISTAEVVAGRNRVNVSNEYTLDEYPSILY